MLRAGVLVATLLVMVPVTGFPILGRLLALGELRPEHVVEYQQISVAGMKNGLYQAPLRIILEQSTLKKGNGSNKNFRTNLKTHRKNAETNHQQKDMLKDLLYQIKLYLITGKSTTIQVLGMHLGPSELNLREKNDLTKVSKNVLKDEKLDVYAVNMTVFCNVKKKSENKKMEQLKLIYFENSDKYTGTKLTLAITLQTETVLKAEETHIRKCQELLGSILVLRLVKQQQSGGRKHTGIRLMRKKKCKNNTGRVLASAKEREFFRENINAYGKDQYKMFIGVKQRLNDKRKGQHNGFTKYDQLPVSFQQKSNVLFRKKMKMQKWKTTKKTVENQKFPLIRAFTQHRCRYNIQTIFWVHKTILSHIKKAQHSTLRGKTTRNKKWRKKQTIVFIAIRESKIRETDIEISSVLYYMQPSVIKHNFLAITTDKSIRGEIFSLKMNQLKSTVYVVKMLKHLVQPFQKVNKYFNVAQKGFRNSALKAHVERKHLGTESLLSTLHLRKHIFQDPSIIERTKRSTKAENVQISVAFLKHLTSALVACATIFGMALSVLSLAACYLYYKRRELKPLLDVVLKDGESLHRTKSSDPNCCTPISLSQAFHFGQSQESSKNQTAVATRSETFPREPKRSYSVESPCKIKRKTNKNQQRLTSRGTKSTRTEQTAKPCSKEESDVTIEEVNASSDSDSSSNGSQTSFTVRSKAYLFPSCSHESMGSLYDDNVCDTSSAQHSSSDESMGNGSSNQPNSNTNQKEKTSVSVAHHSCKNQGHSTSSDELLVIKKLSISKSKSESDIHVSSSKELRPVRSFTIFDGRHNT